MKQIPKKNYLILTVVIVFTLFLALFIRNYYLNYQRQEHDFQLKNLYQIDEDSLHNYIVENGDFILYVANREDKTLLSFEKKFGKFLTEKEYNKNIIYLNLENVSNSFYNDFQKKYFSKNLQKNSFIKQTNLLYFEDKKVTDILYVKEREIDFEDFEEFIETYNQLEHVS